MTHPPPTNAHSQTGSKAAFATATGETSTLASLKSLFKLLAFQLGKLMLLMLFLPLLLLVINQRMKPLLLTL